MVETVELAATVGLRDARASLFVDMNICISNSRSELHEPHTKQDCVQLIVTWILSINQQYYSRIIEYKD